MRERGNILFLILLAVVLFAALSYAVTQSLRGGGNDATGEKMQANIATMFQTLDQIDAALMRMQLTRNIRAQNISFEYTRKNGDGTTQQAYANANCASDSCRLFKPDGGGAVYTGLERLGIPIDGSGIAPGHFDLVMMDFPYAGTSANDVVIRIQKISPDYCAAINQTLGITAAPAFSGSIVAANTPANWDNAALTVSNGTQLLGKNMFASAVLSGSCMVVRLVIAR